MSIPLPHMLRLILSTKNDFEGKLTGISTVKAAFDVENRIIGLDTKSRMPIFISCRTFDDYYVKKAHSGRLI